MDQEVGLSPDNLTDITLVDSFDDFVVKWKAQGGDKITAEVQAILDSRN